MTTEQEQRLIQRAQTDAEAFGELYDLHYATIFNYILRRTADTTAAEDITTEVFMKALTQIKRFTWRGVPFVAWLYRIAANEIANHYRGKHTRYLSLDALMEEQGFEPISDIDIEAAAIEHEETIARHHRFVAVQRMLVTLPDKYQQALSLRYFEKKSIAEISVIMNKPPGTVKSLLSRGTKKLRAGVQPFSRPFVMQPGDKKA